MSKGADNRFVQTIKLLCGQGVSRMLWMNTSLKQRFIHINIPKPYDIFLIKQSCLDLGGALPNNFLESFSSKCLLQRLKPKLHQRLVIEFVPGPKQMHSSKLSNISIS
ncbi:hypothetical protein D3C80_1561020 [compost metagenome]